MKKYLLFSFFLSTCSMLYGQADFSEELNNILRKNASDTSTVNSLVKLAQKWPNDSAKMIKAARAGLDIAKTINYLQGEGDCLLTISIAHGNSKNIEGAIYYALEALKIYRDVNYKVGIVEASLTLQGNYREAGENRKALTYSISGEKLAEENQIQGKLGFSGMRLSPLFLAEIAQTYALMGQLDSALYYTQRSIAQKALFNGHEWNFPVYLLATYQNLKGNYQSALQNYRKAKLLAANNGDEADRDTIQIMSGMSNLFVKMKELDSAIYYARSVILAWVPESELKNFVEANQTLATAYKLKGNADSALRYTEISHALQDSFYSRERANELQQIGFRDELKQQELLTSQANYKSRVQLIGFSLGSVVLLLLAAVLWRSSRREHRNKQKVEEAYNELKATQAQLIQSEKMASLGQLTAGIAHEIQNPLNFVNNFSEVNTELLQEMLGEMEKGNLPEAKNIAGILVENVEKVNQHGKRAGSIVKNMLQHSHAKPGHKETTDINALCDEYMRLSYHGMRAKDSSFNAELRTDYDATIGKINIVPQDIGRVLLNLLNNAFYSVGERRKANGLGYEPAVSISTKKNGNRVEIKVVDNGTGIPQTLKDKIFQPFFTTKPAGQGTGLGLSLSYDIITKGHNGVITVNTEESKFSEFIIQLPIT